jgi:hypothetical protein
MVAPATVFLGTVTLERIKSGRNMTASEDRTLASSISAWTLPASATAIT